MATKCHCDWSWSVMLNYIVLLCLTSLEGCAKCSVQKIKNKKAKMYFIKLVRVHTRPLYVDIGNKVDLSHTPEYIPLALHFQLTLFCLAINPSTPHHFRFLASREFPHHIHTLLFPLPGVCSPMTQSLLTKKEQQILSTPSTIATSKDKKMLVHKPQKSQRSKGWKLLLTLLSVGQHITVRVIPPTLPRHTDPK